MKVRLALLLAGLAVWSATGLYVVGADEAAVVRRCGAAVRDAAGRVRLVSSGLHWDLPWPFARIDRIRPSEIRTLEFGTAQEVEGEPRAFLTAFGADRRGRFLTGDENVLDLRIAVQYRLDPTHVAEALYGSADPESRLRTTAEATTTEVLSRSGVDFVHPLGLASLRSLLTERVRTAVAEAGTGLEVEDVSIVDVQPPVRVKADFLDVSNARADRENAVQAARAYEVQRTQLARAEARRLRDAAETDRTARVQSATAQGESFVRLIEEIRREARTGPHDLATVRRLALERRWSETVSAILSRVSAKVVLQGDRPVDLTIRRDPPK
jgi:membrane protease subunit HflK